jgi:hypothetical protein
MQFLLKIFNFYLKASVHVAFALISLAYVGAESLNILLSKSLLLCLFCGSIMGYNFIKYGVEAQYYIKVSKKAFIPIQILSVLAGLFAFYSLFKLPSFSYLMILLMVIFTSLYTLPLLPTKKNLRAIAGVKIYIVAGVWAIATVLLPLSTSGIQEFTGPFAIQEVAAPLTKGVLSPLFWMGVSSLFFAHFTMVLVLMVPFEIRDGKRDHPALQTIAHKYGFLQAQRLGYLWAGIFLIFQFFNAYLFGWSTAIIGLQLAITVVMAVAVYKSATTSFYFTNFWVESIPILYGLAWFLIS